MISFHRPQEGNFVLSAIFCAIEEDNIDGLHRLLSMASIDINQTNQGYNDFSVLFQYSYERY